MKSSPAVLDPVLDITGKGSRKKPPLQQWQAFSTLYYRPLDSPLRKEAQELYEKRNDPIAISHLTQHIRHNINISTTDYLTFLGAFLRERCTRLSSEEEDAVQQQIEEQQLLAADLRDQPWVLDDDFEDKPLLAENRYIQK